MFYREEKWHPNIAKGENTKRNYPHCRNTNEPEFSRTVGEGVAGGYP